MTEAVHHPLCELCQQDGGLLVVKTEKLRVVRVDDSDYPGFYRVIWNDHVAEFTDLATADHVPCLGAVAIVETLVRQHLKPTKVNLASLGNVVPHLHWHVIARFADDKHFPQPIWGQAQRDVDASRWSELRDKLPALDQAIKEALLASVMQRA
ncbi:MAG: HIT family protein [Burkholderiales bacterium]|nr:HIT family protein [Burkholderiales bacterium]